MSKDMQINSAKRFKHWTYLHYLNRMDINHDNLDMSTSLGLTIERCRA